MGWRLLQRMLMPLSSIGVTSRVSLVKVKRNRRLTGKSAQGDVSKFCTSDVELEFKRGGSAPPRGNSVASMHHIRSLSAPYTPLTALPHPQMY